MRTDQTQNFVKILRAVFEIWTKNIKNAPKMGVFPHLRPPKIFFQKSGSVTFVPLWCTNFMQKIRKILRAVSEIFKDGLLRTTTDYGLRTTDGHGWLHRTLSGKPGVQKCINHACLPQTPSSLIWCTLPYQSFMWYFTLIPFLTKGRKSVKKRIHYA